MDAWLKRNDSRLSWGGLVSFLFYLYFLDSVQCANYSECWFANAMFALFGVK